MERKASLWNTASLVILRLATLAQDDSLGDNMTISVQRYRLIPVGIVEITLFAENILHYTNYLVYYMR